ncbi:MAG TPA: hypothetical protein VFS97_01095 [Nitrososphaeraceae archaeon]|nr:hypothetical protein [Nitrososphaeraceae archaeon]
MESGITSLVRNIAEDASATLSLKRYFVNFSGMQLRGTPAERECKEKLLNRKIKRKRESSMMRL